MRKHKSMTNDRSVKRVQKEQTEKLSTLVKISIEKIIEEGITIKSIRASDILSGYNNQWRYWLKRNCKKRGVKLTKVTLEAFERESLKRIEFLLKPSKEIKDE